MPYNGNHRETDCRDLNTTLNEFSEHDEGHEPGEPQGANHLVPTTKKPPLG